MVEIEWTSPAFRVLEALPQRRAFAIVTRTDLLAEFPEQGPVLAGYHHFGNPFHQLIYAGSYRTIYLYSQAQNRVYIIALQHCRRKLPSSRELRNRLEDHQHRK